MTTDETNITQALEQAQQLVGRADSESIELLASAESFTITTDTQYGQSGDLLKAIKAKEKELDSLRLSVTRPMDEAKSRMMALFKPAAERYAKAGAAIKQAMLTFSREQERRRREAQAKLDEEARKERERLQRLAEAQRERGKEQRAEATEERAASVPALVVSAPEPKVEGITVRRTWRAEVADLMALVKAVAMGEQTLELLEPNMAGLNALARALKDDLAIPGVVAVSEEGIAARAG